MARQQQALAEVILKDPAVESLSSFIGVDGINTTLNSGRILINLKPLDERENQRLRRDAPVAAEIGPGRGIILHAAGAGLDRGGPRQPDPIPIHAGRPGRGGTADLWTASLWSKLKALPQLRDVATDEQPGGLQTMLVIDRQTASRLGSPRRRLTTRSTTLSVSGRFPTLFTQLNQYHVVLETTPDFQTNPSQLQDIYVHIRQRRLGAAQRVHAL